MFGTGVFNNARGETENTNTLSSQVRNYSWLVLALLASAGLSWQSNSHYADSVILFWSLALVMQFSGFAFWRSKTAISAGQTIALMMFLHAIALCGNPMFEDDYFRYLWDGYQVVANGNPYGVAPEVFFADADIPRDMQWVLSGVNNPEVPTIYGPAAQQLFALAYRIDPGNERVLRLLFACCHIGLIALLVRIERGESPVSFNKSVKGAPSMLPLYLLNPMVFKEVALTGHFDFLVPMGLIAAWLAMQKKMPLLAGVLVGLAIATKFIALLALPFFLLARQFSLPAGTVEDRAFAWRHVRAIYFTQLADRVQLLAATGGALVLLYLPFIGASDLAGLSVFANNWRFNAGIYALIETATNTDSARIAAGLFLLVLFGVSTWRIRRDFSSLPLVCIWLYAALILAGPVINPWYWLWLLPFACIARQLWPFLLGSLLLLSYGHGLYWSSDTLAPFQLPFWLQCTEHIGIVLILLWQLKVRN
jgi:alpha-1,6-mannosyltransferase